MSKIWYVLSLDSAVIERDQVAFDEALQITGKTWYEYLQTIENNEIVWYYTITLVNIGPERIHTVKDLYNITPNEKRSRGEDSDTHHLFFLSQSVNTKLAHKLAENLSQLYQAKFCFHTFYSVTCTRDHLNKEAIAPRAISRLFVQRTLTDSVNEGKLRVVNEYPLSDIQEILKKHDAFDKVLNRVPWHWTVFEYVYDTFGSTTATYRFFNEHFGADFKIEEGSVSDYLRAGVAVNLSGSWLVEDKWAYYALTQKGDEKQVTDFLIRVHYKIVRVDSISYIVSLMNQVGYEVNRIEWKNTTSEQTVADFTQRFWPFHFLGTKDHVKKIHALISSTEVPVVFWYTQYGVNEYKGNSILLLPDGVFDMTTHKYFPKDEETSIYFMWGNDGLLYTPYVANASPDVKNVVNISRIDPHSFDEYLAITDQIYADDSSWMIWMIASSMMWYMMYAPGEEAPLFFLTWPTGTGKSTFADILALGFGVKQLYSIGQSTLYGLRVILSSMHRMPAFMTEYRSTMQYKEQKDEMLRLTFDQGNYQRWRQNGDLLSYKMSAQVFLEGEDMYSSGSIRTRTIVHKTRKSGRRDWVDVKKIIRDNGDFLSTFIGSYLMTVTKKEYMKAYEEARSVLYIPGVEPRIIDNFCTFYAGCIAFAPEHRETLVAKMKLLIQEQQADYNENGQSAQIVKIAWQYVASKYANVYLEGNYILFSWDDVTAFCIRERKKMDLTDDSNYALLIDAGFEWDMYEVRDESEWWTREPFMINGLKIHISRCPNKLFSNKKIYQLYLAYQKTLWK